ncbi:long-chain fatty acid--CoA ligase [Acetobacteraceae bacterium H6797]|nr:long-chain fatty acid--CoA ligase [Acetobacteraceae bacterium H6797]
MTGPTAWNSLPAMMLDLARREPGAPMLRYWRQGAWHRMDRAAFAKAVAATAAGLRAKGVSPGDRVVIVAPNRPEILIADTAIMAIGAVTVPTYTTNTVADHAHILGDSGARAVIAADAATAAKLREAAGEGGLDLVVVMDGEAPEGAVAWAEVASTEAGLAMLMAEADEIPSGRLACLIYTSGTGGKPKGVMLPHRSMLANREGIRDIIERLHLKGQPYLSFLPLSHAYEHTVCFLLPSHGMEVVFSRGADKVAGEFREIEPAIITAVPRIFEVLRARIEGEIAKAKPLQRRLFEKTLELGLKRLDGRLGLLEKLQDMVLERLVRPKIRDRFGSRLAAIVSGGARLDPALSGYFLALGVPVLQGYGQTEAGPVISVNLPWDNHRRTVGPPLPGVELVIAPDGEVLVRGPLVMDGYWNQPDATATALRPLDGEAGGEPWLHTGDMGVLEEGRLRITDRKKDFIKTLGGEMVSPAKVESLLMAEPAIAQAVVAGEGEPALSGLIVPADGYDAEAVTAALRKVNARLSPPERVRRHAIVPAFTQDNGMLTPTMKVKRRVVLEAHAGVLEGLKRQG